MAFEKKLGENSKQLSLDLGSIYVPKPISNILIEVSKMDDLSKKSSMLKSYLHSLEQEMKKIDAFKRELPLCMHLLKDAIERLKEEKREMEEVIEMKSNYEGGVGAKGSNDFSEKKNWMSSVQLWSTPIQYESKNQETVLPLKSRCEEEKGSGSGNQVQGCNFKNRGGAFVPFKKPSGVTIKDEKRVSPVPALSLSIPVSDMESIDLSVKEDRVVARPQLHQPQPQQQQRKQRRCWSPELHKIFVDALQQLGGAQTATPKQIRELMKVDGLTNDEVKSHLQKYRLHIRKLPAGSASFSWMNEDFDPVAHSGSPQDHLNPGGSAKGGSAVGGSSMDDEEDEKFETHSCMGWAHGPGSVPR
ncbi:hypothetical protein BUALT_Bualt04G0117100 [Buddleja alternifolia]|uniref:HTH myb-type domain-containing protein n=1 Tax=Buddleja alternifolia TaxID=168488 RepID=A0AAV6XYX5_9LAMI|nr:hypothetical protein BUALT_Bualt04G0117100 [Buddleja alternifolia]